MPPLQRQEGSAYCLRQVTANDMATLQGFLGLEPEAEGGEAAGDRQQPRLPVSELQKRLASRWNPRIVGSTSL